MVRAVNRPVPSGTKLRGDSDGGSHSRKRNTGVRLHVFYDAFRAPASAGHDDHDRTGNWNFAWGYATFRQDDGLPFLLHRSCRDICRDSRPSIRIMCESGGMKRTKASFEYFSISNIAILPNCQYTRIAWSFPCYFSFILYVYRCVYNYLFILVAWGILCES